MLVSAVGIAYEFTNRSQLESLRNMRIMLLKLLGRGVLFTALLSAGGRDGDGKRAAAVMWQDL